MTFLDLARSALRQCGVLLQGQEMSAAEAEDLRILTNLHIQALNSERLSIYSLQETAYAINQGEQNFDIGPGAFRFNGLRPVIIQVAAWNPNAFDARFALDLISASQWSGIEDRHSTGLIVRKLYYDYAFPIATFNIHPIPTVAGKIWLTAWMPFGQITDITADLVLPDAYWEVLHYGLTIRAPQQYGQPVDPANQQLYADAVNRMRQFNAQYIESMVDPSTALNQVPAIGVPPRGPLAQAPGGVPPAPAQGQ